MRTCSERTREFTSTTGCEPAKHARFDGDKWNNDGVDLPGFFWSERRWGRLVGLAHRLYGARPARAWRYGGLLHRAKKVSIQCLHLVSMLFLAASVGLTEGCQSCSADTPMAELVEKQGPVDRDTASEQNKWFTAEMGTTFQVGDAVRTGSRADARLHLDDGSILGLQEETIIRFLDKQPGKEEQALDLVMGEASLLAPEDGTMIRTAFGLARLEGGSKVKLVVADDSLRVQVLLGKAQLENNQGGVIDVSEGQTIETTLGEAVMEILEEETPQANTESEEEPTEPNGPISGEIKGSSVKIQGPGETSATTVQEGTLAIENGSVVQVGIGSSVRLSRGDHNADLGQGTYVVGQDDQLVSSSSNSYTVSSERKIVVRVPGGVITTTGGKATITPEGDDGTRVEAMSGTVLLEGKGSEELSAGEEGRILSDGIVVVEGRGLGRADVEVRPGQSMVVHDPRPPTAIAFLFGSGCNRGKIELKGKKSALPGGDWAKGKGRVALPIAGRAAYTLRCLNDEGKAGSIEAQGTITVLADAGTRPVPRAAPSTSIDVNGRAYTVLYQNQLPRVTVRWSNAPSAESFVLKRSTRGTSRSYSTSSPAYTFSPGALSEGTHSLYFEGGGRVSRRSSVTIVFDNATPTASLQTPANTGVGPGGSLHLVGAGLPGWTVSVDGKPVPQDAEGRFSVSTSMPADGGPKAVYLSHPSRGTHVYLRRPAGEK